MHTVLDFKSIELNPYISSSFTPPQHAHSHVFFEISFCVKGSSINTINQTPFPFQNGSCVILRPGDVHSLSEYDSKLYEHIDIYCKPERFERLCNAINGQLYDEIVNCDAPIFFTLSSDVFGFLFSQSLLLKEMIANENNFFETVYASMITTILSQWIRARVSQKSFTPKWLTDLLPKFNNVNFVQNNITQIARDTGFSLPYFSTQFKKYMGVSAIEYLTKKRVHLAKSLLAGDVTLRILDISGMLGFENPSTFSKHFIKEFNLSPKEFRKTSKINFLT